MRARHQFNVVDGRCRRYQGQTWHLYSLLLHLPIALIADNFDTFVFVHRSSAHVGPMVRHTGFWAFERVGQCVMTGSVVLARQILRLLLDSRTAAVWVT